MFLYDLYDNIKYDFALDDNLTGFELKQVYFSKAEKYNPNDFNVRMLFGGAEIKETDSLYQHRLKDGYTIQILRRKKEVEQL